MHGLGRMLSLLILVGLTACAGVAAERFNQGSKVLLAEAAEKLEGLPEAFGDWELYRSEPLPEAEAAMLQCKGDLHRIYRHRTSGQMINMFMIVGPPGPTSVHSPEICYSSRGFTPDEGAQQIEIDGKNRHRFWKTTLRSQGPTGEMLEVVYGWNAGAGWVAPEHPRVSFGGKPYLYKLQMATSRTSDDQAGDACEQFLKDFLPMVDRTMFSPAAP